MNTDDYNLIKLYLRGDEKSLEILIKRYLKPVYNFIFRYTNNRHEAEDITQEVFVKMWKNLRKFNQQQKFSTWVFAIAKNASIDFMRKKRVIPFSALEDENGFNPIVEGLVDPVVIPENNLAYAIEKLPLEYQKIISLHDNSYFTFKEIAKMFEEPINTIKSRYRRAIISLKRIIK